jgi:hypothetical protein
MSLEALGLYLAPGLHWRVFSDGIVAYVVETCETHLLPAAYGQFMPVARAPAQAGHLSATPQGADASDATPMTLSEETIEQLIALGIVRRVDP